MSASKLIKVFVYGTLKNGQPNHYWLNEPSHGVSKFLGTGKTVESFPLVVGTRYFIPFLLNKKGSGNRIDGEIYEVDETMFGKLDELEQYPEFYDREIQDIQGEDGSIVPCWLYLIRRYPESMLSKKFLTSYTNCDEYPYCESESENPSMEEIYEDMARDYTKKADDS